MLFTLPEYRETLRSILTQNAAELRARMNEANSQLMSMMSHERNMGSDFFSNCIIPTIELMDFESKMNKIDAKFIMDLNIELCLYLRLRNICLHMKRNGVDFDFDMSMTNNVYCLVSVLNDNSDKGKSAFPILSTWNKRTEYTNPMTCDLIHIDRDAKFNYNILLYTLNSDFLTQIDGFDQVEERGYNRMQVLERFWSILRDVALRNSSLEVRDLALIEVFDGLHRL